MGEPIDLADVRWRRDSKPNSHEPTEALRAALRDIQSGEIDPLHLIVVIGAETDNGKTRTAYYQAGSYNHHGQLGLLDAASKMMDRDA
jgi:hypothetical protein